MKYTSAPQRKKKLFPHMTMIWKDISLIGLTTISCYSFKHVLLYTEIIVIKLAVRYAAFNYDLDLVLLYK